jgi:hypothetical protein
MKLTDLHKNRGLKIAGETRQAGVPDRFGKGADQALDRREQRKRDAAAGLVPFACKLHGELVRELQDRAARDGVSVNEAVAALLRKGLDEPR